MRSDFFRIERLTALLVVVFPLFVTFFPMEAYLAPQDFSLGDKAATATLTLSSTAVMVILLAMLAVISIIRWQSMAVGMWRGLPLIIYLAYLILSSQWAGDAAQSFNRSGRHILIVLYTIYLVQTYEFDDLIKLLTQASAISVAACFFAVLFLPSLAFSGLEGYSEAWRGAFVHKNSLGEAMSIAVIFCFYAWKRGINRPVALFGLLGSLGLLFASRSATSIAALASSGFLAVFVAILPVLKRPADKFAMVVIGAGTGLLAWLIIPVEVILEALGRDASLTGRTQIWLAIQKTIEIRPLAGFGHGFWGLPSAPRSEIWKAVGWATPEAHNMWLDIWLQLGMVGLVLFSIAAAIAFVRCLRLIITSSTPGAALWLIVLTNIIVRAFSETEVVDPGTPFLFALVFIGIAKLSAQASVTTRRQAKLPQRTTRFDQPVSRNG